MPFAFTSASSLFIVSFGPWLLGIVINPCAAIARSMAIRPRSDRTIINSGARRQRGFRVSALFAPAPLGWHAIYP
jgi:hypothetical protein